MTSEEILDGNKLIAEFMGLKFTPKGWEHLNEKNAPTHKYAMYLRENGSGFLMRDCIYHSSWDWLMPVVEKVEKIHSEVLISDCSCGIIYDGEIKPKHAKSKIEATWLAVVEFIKWRNQQKTNTNENSKP